MLVQRFSQAAPVMGFLVFTKQSLKQRGLELSRAKTRIVHVDEGFDFLGFTVKRFKGKLLAPPQKGKVLDHLRSIKAYLKRNQQAPAEKVVRDLNPVIRGWANYYRHGTAKRVFTKADHRVWQMLWGWAKRRHPKKPAKWVKQRYFKPDGNWAFHENKYQLVRHSATPVTRYVKVKGKRALWTQSRRVTGVSGAKGNWPVRLTNETT